MREESSSSANADSPFTIQRIRPHHSLGAGVVVSGFSDDTRTLRFRILRSAAADAGLEPGDCVPLSVLASLNQQAEPRFVYADAIAFLRRREHSERELHEKLVLRDYSLENIRSVICELLQDGVLNDERFAEQRVYSRMKGKGRSRSAIVADLRARGVATEVIEMVLDSWERENPGCFDESLRRVVESMPDRNRVDRDQLVRRLQRRGFSLAQILNTLP